MKLMKLIKAIVHEHVQEQELKERSFHSFDSDDILNDKYISNFIRAEDVVEGMLSWFIESEGLDEDDEDTIRLSQEFREFIKDELYRQLEDAKNNIYDKIDYHSNRITLYRAITVDNKWLQHIEAQGKRLGIYWSWDSSGAETHWGDSSKKNEAVIEIDIDEKYVNWEETLRMNLHPNFSEEKEIRLFKNTPITIKSISINDKYVDISKLGGKVFYS